MFRRPSRCALLALLVCCCAASAQITEMASPGGGVSALDAIRSARLDLKFFLMDSFNPRTTEIQSLDGPASWLDLKAPQRPQREYQAGYRLLMRRRPQDAIDFLNRAVDYDPQFFSAHNALGTAWFDLGDYRRAKSEFVTAAALDPHLPSSWLNVACAELALKQYADAEESLRTATRLAPLDAQLQLALAYAEFLNGDDSAVLETARSVRSQEKHSQPLTHLFVAGAWLAQGHPEQATQELKLLLAAEPQSPFAPQIRQLLEQIPLDAARPAAAIIRPDLVDSGKPALVPASASVPADGAASTPPATFHMDENEVGLEFAVLDRGQPVTSLTRADVRILDDHQPPGAVLDFRNENHLPLRLGFVIDTSNSVIERFSSEQAAANRFLENALTGPADLAFVVGFNGTVLLAQDFTSSPALVAHAVNQLAPRGSTALWDAVAFAADKLAERPESGPVARVLVVISDGEDNESSAGFKEALAAAEVGQVTVYTISERDPDKKTAALTAGEHNLKDLSELTGGMLFLPDWLGGLNQNLAHIQQLLRGRYLIAYRPAALERDGRFRSIQIEARKDGHKLIVFTRKGYYASPAAAP